MAGILEEGGVEGPQYGGGVGVVNGGGAQGVPDQGCNGGRWGALAADIAQEEAQVVMAEPEQVVEIPGDLVRGGEVVMRGGLQPRYVRQAGGQRAAVQCCDQDATVLLSVLAASAAHSDIAVGGQSYAEERRRVSAADQHVHSLLEVRRCGSLPKQTGSQRAVTSGACAGYWPGSRTMPLMFEPPSRG
jgi:hypothetical protein